MPKYTAREGKMTTEKQANKAIRDVENAAGLAPKKSKKQKENKVKNFIKSTKFTVIVTILLTALTIYGGYRLYDFVYTQGYQDAQQEQKAIAKQVAELSKEKQ